jgi:hypothetical protein
MLLSHASFGRPVLLTLLHMIVSSGLSFTFPVKQTVTARQSLSIAGLAVVFATSIVAGNLGLSLVHVSFFQVRQTMLYNASSSMSLHVFF